MLRMICYCRLEASVSKFIHFSSDTHRFSALFFQRLASWASFTHFTKPADFQESHPLLHTLAEYYPVDNPNLGEWLHPNPALDSERFLPNLFHYILNPKEAQLVPFWLCFASGLANDDTVEQWPEEFMSVTPNNKEERPKLSSFLATPFHVSPPSSFMNHRKFSNLDNPV